MLPLSRSEAEYYTNLALQQQANQDRTYRYGEPRQPEPQQKPAATPTIQPQRQQGGPMLGDVFSGNSLMGGAHAGFAGAMQGAMGQMWNVNQRNQDASLAMRAMGGQGGGSPQPEGPKLPWQTLPEQAFGQQLRSQNQQRQNDFAWQQKMRNQQLMNANQWRANGFQYPGVNGAGPLGGAFTTNYGAYGNVTNPTMGGGMF